MASWCSTSDDDSSDTHRFGDRFPPLVHAEVTTDAWKGQLDFDRACTGPNQRCWLCTELTPWNRVMHGLGFELVELRPGKLRLRSNPQGDGDIGGSRGTAAAEAAFLVSWLLQHHPCIDELRVAYDTHPGISSREVPFPIHLRSPIRNDPRRSIRGLEIEENASACFDSIAGVYIDCYKLKDLDDVSGLERLKLDFNKIRPKLAAELAKLLRRNAGSIKRFKISKVKLPRQVNKALRYLFSCESLTISSYHDWCDRLPSMDSVARLLHSSTALKELSIAPIASRRQMDAIANELANNTSLEKLGVHVGAQRCSPEPVFTALQRNTTLRELRVTGCRIRGFCAQALGYLVCKNTGLRLLYIWDADVSELCLIHLAGALNVNTTLETLRISSKTLPLDGVAALVSVLSINKTLKKLVLTGFKCPQQIRAVLAKRLTENDCYGRVQLPWTEPDLPGLTAALTSSLPIIEELVLSNILCLSLVGLRQLFDALASNKSVRTFRVTIKGDPGEKGTALCEMLKVNRSIDCLDLAIDGDGCKFVEEISHALAENAGITDITLGIHEVRQFETATALSYLLAHNKTATKFYFAAFTSLSSEFVEEFSQGMLQNRTIVKFGLSRNLICDDSSFPFFEAVRRNRGALNRAVDFVVSPSLDRQCAEGFDLFAGRSCLLKHLTKVTGKTEPEALLAVAAAKRYLRDNYLRITGIVRHSVTCHPAEATQVDALNKDCWLAIVRHLEVADVLT